MCSAISPYSSGVSGKRRCVASTSGSTMKIGPTSIAQVAGSCAPITDAASSATIPKAASPLQSAGLRPAA